MKKSLSLALMTAGLMAGSLAHAHEAGSLLVRGGLATVAPTGESSTLEAGGAPVAGAQVDVGPNSQLGLTASYVFAPHFGVGLLAATPFKHDIDGEGLLGAAGKLGDTRHLPPTLTLQYFPMQPGTTFQPYLGVGVNYTWFFNEGTNQALDNTFQSLGVAAQRTSLQLDNSVGVAFEAGFDWMFTDHLGMNMALWYIDIDTEADISANDAAGNQLVSADVDVDIDPIVYNVGLTYRF